MTTVAIITARGGSKRIPRKNLRPFLGKPVIGYSIEAALGSGLFDEVMVSTDDAEIADLCRSLGAVVPFMRSAENANDMATTLDVLVEVLGEYRQRGTEFDFACCIYPTAPFVTADKLRTAFARLQQSGADTVLPIVRFDFPIWRSFRRDGDKVSYLWPEFASHRSQDLPPAYHDAGQFYFFRPRTLLAKRELITANTVAIEMPTLEVQDLDEEQDWKVAEAKFASAVRQAEEARARARARRIVLGTAQFGMSYGISNSAGKVGVPEVRRILGRARSAGITDVDTARSYGDSERVLGLAGSTYWNVYTKLPKVPREVLAAPGGTRTWVMECVRESMVALRSETVAGLMLHYPQQLWMENGASIYEALVEQRDRGLVGQIGISIYGPQDLDLVPPWMTFDFVQGPLNVLDMRLADTGWLSRLAEAGCTFFARSIFLQGLLLMPGSERPRKFDTWPEVWRAWDAYLREAGVTAVQACLGHALSVPNVGKVIVGVTSEAELKEVLAALSGDLPPLPCCLSTADERILEPMNWQYL